MEQTKKEKEGLNISTKSFLVSLGVIFALMVLTYLLTFIVPGGVYSRVEDADGNLVIGADSVFTPVEGGIPFLRWILSPVLVLGASGSATLIAVLAFLLVIGGAFAALEKSGLMRYMLDRVTARFGASRYRLMAVVLLLFMGMGSLIGSFEECVPLVPIVTALTVALGWDAVTGLAMTILAAGCGFAAGVCNPFTVGVAQKLAGLPMFSGIWLRAVSFVLIYALLFFFVRSHARRVERPVAASAAAFVPDRKMDIALFSFAGILGTGIVTVLLSGFITALQDYTMIIVAVMFLIAGICASKLTGMRWLSLGATFGRGVLGILPAVLMILMASSIKYTLEEAQILDTVLHTAVEISAGMSPVFVVLFIYLCVLVMNFFVASGSAKAFMLIPLIVPIAQMNGIPAQLCVLAYAFGDGFSNVFYPTNPALLIALGASDVGYGTWAKWSWKFQAANLALTSLVLLFGFAVGYC